jgi:hypothetical protein
MVNSAFLNSGGMTFDGTIQTIGFSGSLFVNNSIGNPCITLPATSTVTRRFRIIYSSFVVLGGRTGIDVDASLSITNEGYILDTVNFGGGGTFLSGIDDTSNKTLFINCTGIVNTSVNGQLYMNGNDLATTIDVQDDFYKVAGTTIALPENSKFDSIDNRLICKASIERRYLLQCTLSFTAGATNICKFGFYDSKSNSILAPSIVSSTANAGGRAENVSLLTTLKMSESDYVEVHCANTSGLTSITVSEMNFLITEL